MAGIVNGKWTRLSSSDLLQRSSQSVAASDGKVYIFGGELIARNPRDSHVFELNLNDVDAALQTSSADGPTPRVGSTMSALGGKLYIFSGRGGEAMTPINESGSFQVFDPASKHWSTLSPKDASAPVPDARSYHCAATDGTQHIYIHAGCPEKGRLSDLWDFDVEARAWKKLDDAPGMPRGGTSIAYAEEMLWRMNGFDGKSEIGGALDLYDIQRKTWTTIDFAANGQSGPGARSVSALVATKIGGVPHLVTMFGEADPSSLGHAGAGKMLSDVWAWSIAAKEWKKVKSSDQQPLPRGWFDAASNDNGQIVVTGGLADTNERIADAWLLEL